MGVNFMFSEKIEDFLNSSNIARREIIRKLQTIKDIEDKFNSKYNNYRSFFVKFVGMRALLLAIFIGFFIEDKKPFRG